MPDELDDHRHREGEADAEDDPLERVALEGLAANTPAVTTRVSLGIAGKKPSSAAKPHSAR